MAAFTTVQTGNWTDPYTWTGSVVGSLSADQPANGSFESPGVTAGGVVSNPSMTSWTASANTSVQQANNPSGWPASPDGSQQVLLTTTDGSSPSGTPGDISQSFTLGAGSYVVSIQSAKFVGSGQILRVQIDGVTVLSAAPAGTSFAAQVSSMFTIASGGSHTIAIRNSGSVANSYLLIDKVEIYDATAPTAIPGNGDTVTINHAVTVDANTTVGTSPSDTTTVVYQQNAAVTVAAVTFKVRGNAIQQATGNDLTLSAGSILEVDDSAAGSPTEYEWRKGNSSAASPKWIINGSSGSQCIVRKNSGGSRWSTTTSGTGKGANVAATWTTFRGVELGGQTDGSPGLTFSDCFFDNSFVYVGLVDDCPFTFTRCLWLNTPVGEYCIRAEKNGIVSGWNPVITDCGFDAIVNIQSTGLTADGAIFLGGYQWSSPNTAAGSRATGFTDCLQRITFNQTARYGDWTESLFFEDGRNTYDGLGEYTATSTAGSLHWFAPLDVEPGVYAVTNCVLESAGSDGASDIDYTPSSTNTSAFSYCLFLPDPATSGGASVGLGTMTTNNATGGASTYDHCTYYGGQQGAMALAELGNGAAGIIGSLRSNILWNDPLNAGTGPFNKAVYQSTVPPGAAVDMVNPNQCGWNCLWNLNSATVQTNAKPYYDTDFSSPSNNVGQNDVVGNPGFVAPTRNLATWVASLESTWAAAPSGNYSANASPSRTDYLAHGLYKLQVSTSRPTHPDADARYTLAAYLAYVRNGFRPTNVSLKDAGHDSVTIGALEGAWAGAGAMPLIGGGLVNRGLINGGLVF